MDKDVYPLSVVQAVPRDAGIRFLHPKNQYEIDEFVEVIWFVLAECNGYENLNSIIAKTASKFDYVSPEIAKAIVEDLISIGVLLDSREHYTHFHLLTKNPMFFSQDVTFSDIRELTTSPRLAVNDGEVYRIEEVSSALSKMQAKRRSCRSFSINDQLSINQLAHILVSGYSLDNRTTPSAGGLYPLKIYVVATRNQDGFTEGYFEYNPECHELVRFNETADIELLQYAFDSDTLLFNAPIIVVIAADLERHTGKYSNRGYRYTLLEAGHVAQNMHLAATEQDVASLEYGGFLDDVLAKELSLESPRVQPLVSIALGIDSGETTFNAMYLLEDLESELVGTAKPVRYVRMTTGSQPDKGETFFGATALYKPSPNQDTRRSYKQRFAAGTATSSALAQIKAIAEAYERFASSSVRVDYVGTSANLCDRWINPSVVAPLSKEQFQFLPFLQPFSPHKSWEWVCGEDTITGAPVWVPVDLVFYPLRTETFGRKLCHEASSSGVAAYTSESEAVKRALLELIERDSVIRNWFARESPNQISLQALPYHWKRRVAHWVSSGRDVFVLDLSRYGVVTINVVIVSPDAFPCFVNGSASSLVSFDEAVSKAFHEAELGLIHALRGSAHHSINPEDVLNPIDHAKLYALPEHFANLKWLWQGKEQSSTPEPTSTIESLFERFKVVKVRLSPDSAPLHVIRVLSEELVPISFGYGTEHYLHHTLVREQLHVDSLSLPHYFA